jgi:hypothetical protein
VSEVIINLKDGKGDGITELSTDHFKHACPELSVYVSFYLLVCLANGTLPIDMVQSTVIPISKERTDQSDSTNYRGIALSSIFGRILD